MKEFRKEGKYALLKDEKKVFARILHAKLNFTYLNIVYPINIKLKVSVWV